jgi:hypothetical protein
VGCDPGSEQGHEDECHQEHDASCGKGLIAHPVSEARSHSTYATRVFALTGGGQPDWRVGRSVSFNDARFGRVA